MSRVIAILACGFALAACSASLSLPSMDFLKSSPPTEKVRIESEPPGAEAKSTQGQACRTPCEMTVQTEGDVSVTVALNGYQPQTVPLRSEEVQGESSFGGSKPRMTPNPVFVELQAVPPVAPAKKKKKVAAPAQKKPAVATTAPATATQSASAETTPPPMTAETPASSGASYPWPSR
jgi:hypothetical protein